VKEMEARPFQDDCDANKVYRSCRIIFHSSGGPKAPQWGGLIIGLWGPDPGSKLI